MMITLCSKAMRRNIFQKCLLSTSSELRSDRFTETVEMNIKDRVAYLTLCRPEKRNALSTSALERLMERMEEIESSKGINVVVLQHLGPAFSSGHDLKEVMADEMGKEEYAKLFKLCSDAMMKISRSSKPVIAKVDGIATAAGCQLVASCDLAYSTEKSFFATPGVNIGLFCSTPAVALSRVLSRKHAMEMLLIGDMIDANTAFRMGLINQISKNTEELESKVTEIATKIASKSPTAIKMGKRAFNRQIELGVSDAYDIASDTMVRNLLEDDADEGISAFLQKRSPVWREVV